jgi:hypothetical protein
MEGYPIGNLNVPPKINIHLAYKKKIVCLKLPTLENPTFTFDLTQIQMVIFQNKKIFLFKITRSSNMGLKLSLNL